MESIDQVLAHLAKPQCGAFTYEQAVAAGVSKGALARRCRRGAVHRRHSGTYIFGCHAGIPLTETWAALLTAGSDGLLARESAAYQWRFSRRSEMPPPELLVTGRQRPIDGATILQSRTLHPEDRATCNRFSVTSPERTIVDLADVRSVPQLCRYLREAAYLRILDIAKLRRTMQRNLHRRGTRRMRLALERFLHGDNGADNRNEARFARKLRRAGISGVIGNKRLVLSETVVRPDVWIEHAGLAIELDERSHELEPVMREDALKDALYRSHGIPTVRVLDHDLDRALEIVLRVLDDLMLRTSESSTDSLVRSRSWDA